MGEHLGYSDDGFLLDDWGREVGYCNACGEEAYAESECCEDGEIVPPEDGATCAEHGDPLVREGGGTDMPTISGRWYCAVCQTLLTAVLTVNDVPRVYPSTERGGDRGE